MKMVALKRVYYPDGGRSGHEYQPGEEFEIVHAYAERDREALIKTGRAKDAPAEQRKALESAPAPVQTRAMAPEPDANQDASAGEGAGFSCRYKRRDMNPET